MNSIRKSSSFAAASILLAAASLPAAAEPASAPELFVDTVLKPVTVAAMSSRPVASTLGDDVGGLSAQEAFVANVLLPRRATAPAGAAAEVPDHYAGAAAGFISAVLAPSATSLR
jgi:hypothetical protein